MKRRWYRITLLEPLILSERNVTEGDHSSLDFIPGRTLLGLAAGRCYAELEARGQAWTAFHQGAVRFGDALVLDEAGRPGVPVPLSLHGIKREDADRLYNHAADARLDRDRQYEQKRDGHLVLDEQQRATHVQVRHSSTLKTAIDAEAGGRARDSHLFSYQAIARGQAYAACLEADDEVDDAVLDTIEAALVGEKRLGRSRSAEFGAVTIERLGEDFERAWSQFALPRAVTTRAVIMLLGELALEDERTGAPRLMPQATDFGLPADWALDLEHSFVRFRSYDRFNGYRKSFDVQRQVLQRGAVLVFTGQSPLTDAQWNDALAHADAGAGLDRQEGLGRYLLNPGWLVAPSLALDTATTAPGDAVVDAVVDVPDAALLAFLEQRVPSLSRDQQQRLHDLAGQLASFCAKKDGRRPGKSQWSRVRKWARVAKLDRDSFLALVGGTAGTFSRGWESTYEGKELGTFVVELAPKFDDEQTARHFISELAHLVRGKLTHREQSDRKEVAR